MAWHSLTILYRAAFRVIKLETLHRFPLNRKVFIKRDQIQDHSCLFFNFPTKRTSFQAIGYCRKGAFRKKAQYHFLWY